MAVITDFGPERSRWWPNVDDAHFTVHEQRPDWAEVTEGTGMGWERERNSWDATSGIITIDTLEVMSNSAAVTQARAAMTRTLSIALRRPPRRSRRRP